MVGCGGYGRGDQGDGHPMTKSWCKFFFHGCVEIGFAVVGFLTCLIFVVVIAVLLAYGVRAFVEGRSNLYRDLAFCQQAEQSWEYCMSDGTQYESIKECWRYSAVLP